MVGYGRYLEAEQARLIEDWILEGSNGENGSLRLLIERRKKCMYVSGCVGV